MTTAAVSLVMLADTSDQIRQHEPDRYRAADMYLQRLFQADRTAIQQ